MKRGPDIVLSVPVGPKRPDCAWCGLRISDCVFQSSPCCNACRDGGRAYRVRMAAERFKRGKGA